VPYEICAKTGEVSSPLWWLLELAHVDDILVRNWAGKIIDLGALEAEAAEA
jgi:hypothetical protein